MMVIDDDESLRNALQRMLQLHDYRVKSFACAEEFLTSSVDAQTCCLLLDLQLPGLSGIDLQNFLLRKGTFIPIVFISGHGNIPTAIRAIKSGAVTFLTKPFTQEELLAEIDRAVELCRKESAQRSEMTAILHDFETLTAREKQILEFVVTGKLNKQTASDLGIVIHTVKVHRRRIMRKMHAESLAELVLIAQKLRGMKGQFSADLPAQIAKALQGEARTTDVPATALAHPPAHARPNRPHSFR